MVKSATGADPGRGFRTHSPPDRGLSRALPRERLGNDYGWSCEARGRGAV